MCIYNLDIIIVYIELVFKYLRSGGVSSYVLLEFGRAFVFEEVGNYQTTLGRIACPFS